MGTSTLEPVSIRFEQIFPGRLWLLSALIAWACIRSGQMALHKAWMMRSYGFTLIFVLSRVPDAFIKPLQRSVPVRHAVVAGGVALIAPEVILTAQTLLRIRNAKARHARTAAADGKQLAAAE
jgi:uncharacterized membrane protein YozB (DUF420 family)